MAEDLFGNALEDAVKPSRDERKLTNNMATITTVLERARSDLGYVVAGVARRVYRKTSPTDMKQIPLWESEAVLQLVDGGQLTTGGTHLLRCGAVRRQTSSVLVPKATKDMLSRWAALAKPSTWKG